MNDFCINYFANVAAGITLAVMGGAAYHYFFRGKMKIKQNIEGKGTIISVVGNENEIKVVESKANTTTKEDEEITRNRS